MAPRKTVLNCAPEQIGPRPGPPPSPRMPDFVPSWDWREVKDGQAIPKGLQVNMDMATGKKFAKWKGEKPLGEVISDAATHVYRYLECGAQLHPVETLLVYASLPFVLSSSLQDFFLANGVMQLSLFVLVVQLPLFFTGHMLYVDIGWPTGLVLLALNGLRLGTGFWLRRWLMCGCLLLHGGRMCIGAIIIFGQKSGWTFRFQADLPRYAFAKKRWTAAHGMPADTWGLKSQQDTLQQCWANAVLLAAPVALVTCNPSPELAVLEVIGWSLWLLAWVWENVADVQKHNFLQACRSQGASADAATKTKLKTAVIGMAPFNTRGYSLWTLCRHPNYFGEWLAWVGLTLAALPSAWALPASLEHKAMWIIILLLLPRFLYDCLVHWTGAGPAEHFSVRKRPQYKQYQQKVRCFFPFDLPIASHHRVARWPSHRRA